MECAAFAERARAIEGESADGAVREAVTELLRAAGDELPVVTRYVQGRVFPAHDATKLDVGPSLCYEAIAKAAGRNVSATDVEARVAEVGDVGEVAAAYDFGSQRGLASFGDGGTEGLTVAAVDARLRELATAEGAGSQDRKRDLLFGLFTDASPDEARYLARLVLGEMRIGVGEGTVRDAIAAAFDAPVETVERAIQVTNDCGEVAVVARTDGEAGLADLGLVVGRPVGAMLAQTGSVREALDAWGEAAVEWKFDGARVQVHYDGSEVSLFSRNMEDVTDPLPEVVEAVERAADVPAILDGEVVAVDDDGAPLPFQEVLRRFRRKHDVAAAREDVAVQFRAFDCLHADGDDLLDAPLVERHERLRSVLGDEAVVSTPDLSDGPDEIAAIESESLAAGHEGIMLKNPESAYTPGRRGKNWLKRKPDVETLDLVVTGAEWGEGRRANLLGTFLLAARVEDAGGAGADANSPRFETIGKVATGITDEELEAVTDLLEPHVRSEDGTEVDIEPAVVFEVGYEEIQPSPTYSSGYALRFPRFLGVREDLDPTEADSIERVECLADRQ